MRFRENMTDQELIACFKSGSRQAGEEVVRRYYPKVLALCCQMMRSVADGQDATQEVFYKTIVEKKILAFRGQAKLLTWLIRIAMNVCKSYYRRRKNSLELRPFVGEGSGEAEYYWVSNLPGPDEVFWVNEQREQVLKGIAQLPAKCRKAMHYVYIKEYSYKEAARDLKVPVNILGVRLMYGRKLLLRYFRQEFRKDENSLNLHASACPQAG